MTRRSIFLTLAVLFVSVVLVAPPAHAAGCGPVTNDTDTPMFLWGGTSTVTVAGCDRNASANAQVEVHVELDWRDHASVYLEAADGTRYLLKAFGYDFGSDIHETCTVDLSAEPANGTWRLLIFVHHAEWPNDFIDSWTLAV